MQTVTSGNRDLEADLMDTRVLDSLAAYLPCAAAAQKAWPIRRR